MRADPRRIHELEYELGFRDDPPPSSSRATQSAANVSAVLKQVYADEPGQVIYYRPPAVPTYVGDLAAVTQHYTAKLDRLRNA